MCNPGLGFKAPAEARVGNYIDKKCPFTGKVSFIGEEIENSNLQMVEDEVLKRRVDTVLLLGVHPWTYPHWCCGQAEDEQDCCHQEGLPALRQEVQQVC